MNSSAVPLKIGSDNGWKIGEDDQGQRILSKDNNVVLLRIGV